MVNRFEGPPIYNEEGRVPDPEIAREGAEVEDKYRKKLFGVFKRSEGHIDEGMENAELVMEQEETVEFDSLPKLVKQEVVKHKRDLRKKDESIDVEIMQIIQGTIGDRTTRYHVYLDTSGKPTVILTPGSLGMPGAKVGAFNMRVEPGSSKLDSDKFEIIVDVKDNKIIQSKIEPD
jgi:hypothetical protein